MDFGTSSRALVVRSGSQRVAAKKRRSTTISAPAPAASWTDFRKGLASADRRIRYHDPGYVLRHLEQNLRQPVGHVDHRVVAARQLVDAPARPRLDFRLCAVERRVGITGGANISLLGDAVAGAGEGDFVGERREAGMEGPGDGWAPGTTGQDARIWWEDVTGMTPSDQ